MVTLISTSSIPSEVVVTPVQPALPNLQALIAQLRELATILEQLSYDEALT